MTVDILRTGLFVHCKNNSNSVKLKLHFDNNKVGFLFSNHHTSLWTKGMSKVAFRAAGTIHISERERWKAIMGAPNCTSLKL